MNDAAATILIVDDEPFNVDYLQQNLSDLGYRTREAYGGREALDSVAESPPDLILLDVMMPDIDGITVCQMLKGDPATQLIPIVIMTALDGKEDRIRGIEAGADDFLTKPVDDRELLARINAALRIKQAVDETVGELASAAQQLEDMAPRVVQAAVIAMEFRSGAVSGADPPNQAHDYLITRYERAARETLERLGADVVEKRGDHILAVLPGLSPAEAIAPAEAIQDEADTLNRTNTVLQLSPAIAVHHGDVSIEPHRVEAEGRTRWVLAAGGATVDTVMRMVAEAADGEVLASPAVLDAGRADQSGSTAQRRVLATILVSDLVGSTEIATRLGDQQWTEALDGHYRLVRDTFALFDGEEISTAGDGFMALFDGPAKAIRAALEICHKSEAAGFPVRVGIHTGEVERTDGDIQGINVHLASRVSAEADGGEVLVSSTTRDAAAGSGLRFEDSGERTFKGIEEARRVYLVLPD